MDPLFETKVKQAFSKVKEDIHSLRTELREYKALIKELVNKLSIYVKDKSLEKDGNFNVLEGNTLKKDKSSIGNKGVYSFTHSLTIHSLKHSFTYSNR